MEGDSGSVVLQPASQSASRLDDVEIKSTKTLTSLEETREKAVSRLSSANSTLSRRSKTQLFKPPPQEDNDDLETVLDISERRDEWDSTGQIAYEKACKRYGVIVSSSFHNKLRFANSIDLGYYGVGVAGAKAIAVAFCVNRRITTLRICGNQLGVEGASYICEMLMENDCITHLDMGDNNIRFSDDIAEMLRNNTTITDLSLHDNNFTDRDAAILAQVIESHPSLAVVNLSANNFGSTGGLHLSRMISENTNITDLNLSWNKINGEGAVAIAEAVRDNVGMKTINLEWNGFDRQSGAKLAEALGQNRTLTELNMFSNRIDSQAFLKICEALKDNDMLVTLKVGKNFITEEAAEAALELFKIYSELKVETVDLSDLIFSAKLADKVKEVQEIHENFKFIYGYTDSYGKRKLKSYDVVDEALTFFRQYMTENDIDLVTFFQDMDEDGSMAVSYDEFREGLKAAKIPLTPLQVDQLIAALDMDGDGDIDFGELVIGAEEHSH